MFLTKKGLLFILHNKLKILKVFFAIKTRGSIQKYTEKLFNVYGTTIKIRSKYCSFLNTHLIKMKTYQSELQFGN